MKVYLAPMEGITTFIYRNAFQRYYGGIDKYFTPFLSSQNLNYKEVNDVLPAHNQGIPLVPQILANRAETFLAIAAQLEDYGYREVNLNLGCPSGTVVARKRGAGFLGEPEALDSFLGEIFAKCPLDISLKTRIGVKSTDEWERLLTIYAQYPVKELIVHPRLQQEFYNGHPHEDAFIQARDMLSVPLCYNGDITSADAFGALEDQTGAVDTVMLGRGAIANPQLPAILKSKTQDNTLGNAPADTPAKTRDLKTFQNFHGEILAGYQELMYGEQPVLFRMKELWTYMGAYMDLSDRQLKKIRKASRLSDYQEIVRTIWETA